MFYNYTLIIQAISDGFKSLWKTRSVRFVLGSAQMAQKKKEQGKINFVNFDRNWKGVANTMFYMHTLIIQTNSG